MSEWKEDTIFMNKHNMRLIKITGKIITDSGNTFWRGEAIDETPLTSKVKGDVVILDDDDLKNWSCRPILTSILDIHGWAAVDSQLPTSDKRFVIRDVLGSNKAYTYGMGDEPPRVLASSEEE